MVSVNRQHTAPITVPRSRRNHSVAVLTSFKPGLCVPLAAIPLLREDGLNASVRVAVEMLETKELLMNPVNLRLTAYVVPLLAFERFEGSRDQFDRSFKGEPKVEGGTVVPFIETHAFGAHGSNAVYKALGLHAKPTDQVNTAYLEAYNLIRNFRAKNRSANLPMRTRLDTTLAKAFWPQSRFEHVVPTFDQAAADGEVSLNVIGGNLALKKAGVTVGNVQGTMAETGTTPGTRTLYRDANTASGAIRVLQAGTLNAAMVPQVDFTGITAELQAQGVTLSLSNLELARKAQAFAKLREQFDGFDDDYIIDMLMDGLTIPDQNLKQPILLADQTVRFSQAKRYATDSGNLAESAVSGGTIANLRLRVPRINTGGIVMVIAEVVPEQLFERQRDPWFFAGNTRDMGDLVDLPAFLRDFLDPEKVDIVKKGEIDTDHANAAETFGFAPKNWKWNAWGARVGGKFLRPTANTSVDDVRQRIWAVEDVNPVLGANFYEVASMHQKPFLDTEIDNFEASLVGNAVIDGNTVFGPMLIESGENYDAVMAKADQDRIVQP